MSVRAFKFAVGLLGSAAILAFSAASGARANDGFTSLNLPAGGLSGNDALRAVGQNLPRIAAQYGKTPNQLRNLLLKDKSLKVARNGRLYYAEDAAQVPRRGASDAVLNGAPLPLDQTFRLHSNPGANRILILNFQGKTVTGTYWNTSLGKTAIVATPFNLDANPATFNDAERTAIQLIWKRVAEDYAPFNVDVTTDINAAASAPAGSMFATAVITRQGDYFGSSPGIAYVSTFGNDSYDPAFVAYDTLGRNPKHIAEAVSHEFGHRLGLDHDGTATSAYYAGHGTAPMRWAPIMGVSYTANISQFSKGEYAGANNRQDDYLMMTRYLPLKADDVGNSPAQATDIVGVSTAGTTSASADGVIETFTDVDVYAISASAGPLSATANPVALNPNLDIALSLIDDTGAVVASSTPTPALSGTLSTTLPRRGVYYLKVAGTGSGNPLNTGFSTYGSRGYYRLSASYPTTTATPPRAAIAASTLTGLAPLTVTFNGGGSSSTSPITAYGWDMANGSRPAGRVVSATFRAPGTYPVTLKVTNADGLSNQTQQKIIVAKEVSAALTVTRVVSGGTAYAEAVVANSIVDGAGLRLIDPVVTGIWSGSVTGEASKGGLKKTGIKLVSPSTPNTSACFTFTVTRIDGFDPADTTPETDAAPKQRNVYMPRTPIRASTCTQQVSR